LILLVFVTLIKLFSRDASISYPDSLFRQRQVPATEYKYDWRGRQTHTLGEADEHGHYIQTVQNYDNLNRIVKTEQYLCQEKQPKNTGKHRNNNRM
jgi:hypothetical protein